MNVSSTPKRAQQATPLRLKGYYFLRCRSESTPTAFAQVQHAPALPKMFSQLRSVDLSGGSTEDTCLPASRLWSEQYPRR